MLFKKTPLNVYQIKRKSIVYLDTSNKHMETKNLNVLSFTIIKKREIGVNLIQPVQDLYTENHKTLLVYSSFSNSFKYPVPFPFLIYFRINTYTLLVGM